MTKKTKSTEIKKGINQVINQGKFEDKFEEVKKIAWDACNIFRGSMDATSYKDYILHMLFLKYISDIQEALLEEMPANVKGNKSREESYRESLDFNIPDKATFNAIYKQKNTDEPLGAIIDKAFDDIEEDEANKDKLEDVFQGVEFNNPILLGDIQSSNDLLRQLLEAFNKLDLRPQPDMSDIIGKTYMFLIERFASDAGKKAGEFFTPSQVSNLLARLASPLSGEHVCDPAAGSGGLLLQVAAEAKPKKVFLHGMENNSGTWSLCKMNMFVHGHSGQNIHKCDSLLYPKLVDKNNKLLTFDLVVANPPFSLKNWGRDKVENDTYGRFHRGIPPSKAADWAFITHMIESAKPSKGRVAVITPHGVLFRGAAEGVIRQAFIQENLLDAVIGLPSNLFQTTSIPVAILIFDRKREEGGPRADVKDVIFIDASAEYIDERNQNSLSEKHLTKIIDTYKDRKEIKRYSRKVTLDEIKETGYNLNISRYVDSFPEEEKVDVAKVQKEILELESQLAKTQKQMKKFLEEIV